MGLRAVRRGGVTAAIALAASVVGAHAAGGESRVSGSTVAPSCATGPAASIGLTSQSRILTRGRMRVRAFAPRGCGRVALRLRGALRFAGKDRKRVTRKRSRLRLGAGRSRAIPLRLTNSGRARVARCRERRLVVKGSARYPKRPRLGRKRLRAAVPLTLDAPRCGRDRSGDPPGPGTLGPGDTPGPGAPSPPAEPADPADPPAERPGDVELEAPERCDFTDPAVCLFPWPNDHFTTTDPATDTGRRLALHSQSMPRNRFDQPIDPVDYNRNDGFSPGQKIVTKVPGLETQAAFEATGAPPITDVERSLDADSPVVVIDAHSGERHLVFSEIDANPANPADVTLLIRPAVNFAEGRRYIVALRNLRDAGGEEIPAQPAFEIYRDRIATSEPAIEDRRAHFEELFDSLADAGIDRDDLYLAWDFTVASERNLSERILTIRDDAFAELGDTDLSDLEVEGEAPSFAVTGVTDYAPCGEGGCGGGLPIDVPSLPLVGGVVGPLVDEAAALIGSPPEDDRIARKVEGQFVVPCYTDLPLCPTGSKFAFSSPTDTIPERIPGNVALANFTCLIPRSATEGGVDPARPSLYGHGLLGSASEVQAGNVKTMANEHNFVFCATDWAGFATQDAPTVLTILQDLSHFPRLVDRTQQGILNFMFLGRLMIHPEGFSAHEAFRIDGEAVIDRERLFYDGNSQGGILGGALTAVAPDFDRAVLGVPGMNYSTLLRRSSDFPPYAEGEFVDGVNLPLGVYDSYPDELERPLVLSMVQILWDRGEANGYAHHMTSDPPPNTPPHEVLLHVAFGDHQVSMWTAEIEARTIGAHRHAPTTDPGRHPDFNPYFGIPPIPAYPFDGSALIVWDSGPPREGDQGVVAPPTTNTHPDSPEFGRDPHSDPRNDVQARIQKSEFLRVGGRVVNVCGDHPCYTRGWTGP